MGAQSKTYAGGPTGRPRLGEADRSWPAPRESVQGGRRVRLVAPRPAPQLLALGRAQPAAHADDRFYLLERRAASDPLLEGRPDLVHHGLSFPLVPPEAGRLYPDGGGHNQVGGAATA